ncbi:MAG: hypothetical protein WAN48_04335 [Actinomycetes bacterium]
MPELDDVADRCGRAAAWATAALRGQTSSDTAATAIVADDGSHEVVDLPGVVGPQGWAAALATMKSQRTAALRFVPAVPGDVLGLPGPAPFNAAAAASGGAVLLLDTCLALVPTVVVIGPEDDQTVAVRWAAWSVEDRPGQTWPTPGEAGRDLTEQLSQALAELERLDVAAFRPEAVGLLRSPAATASPLPPGWPERAHQLLVRSQAVLSVIASARLDDGLAISSAEAVRRDDILRGLERSARLARAAAWNASVVPRPLGSR